MRSKIKKRYNIDQCALYKCASKKRLTRILRITDQELNNLNSLISYHSFDQVKKDGDRRSITAPNNDLKKIQKRILRLFVQILRPNWLVSGERGKSYIDNARSHLQSNYFLTIDIRKFYDNCSRNYVYNFFKHRMKMSSDVSALLTDIVTLERKIPTGCPTSQLIAYYAYEEMFQNIHDHVTKEHGCIFTLYVDDMTFSSNSPFNPGKLANDIDIILRRYGHKPKYSKVKYYSRKSNKLVTGVVVSKNNQLLVANNLRKKIYKGAMGQLEIMEKGMLPSGKELVSLKGRIQAGRNVNPRIFPELNRMVDSALLLTQNASNN